MFAGTPPGAPANMLIGTVPPLLNPGVVPASALLQSQLYDCCRSTEGLIVCHVFLHQADLLVSSVVSIGTQE